MRNRTTVVGTIGALLLSLAPRADAAEPVALSVERSASVLQVRATIAAEASAELCYGVIADFDRLADFIPSLKSSQIVSDAGQPLRLRQIGETTLGFSSYAIDVTLALETDPPRRIRFSRVAGNLDLMEGDWRVEGDAARCRVDYRAALKPQFWVPPLIGTLLARRQVETQLEGLKAEIDRRADLQRH
jgi:ribosome-associated toxin RatA of RatAB toxin-antitoxin module